ncbi:JmjC domain-containing protein [Streptomyces sp. NPDC001668]|uniref:JmjC domain-containing protein n=1 Tax=Streptomyces sp. NPDC001668 TaxID=3364598 RepID=UPI0036CBD8A3
MNDAWPPNRDFWTGEFPGQTSNRTAPYLFKGIIPATAAGPDDVLAGLEAMRRAHAAGTPYAAKARVYVGEERHDELVESVLTKDGWDDGAFVEWMQSLVGADRFSLVINNLETVSPSLAAGFGPFLRSLFEGWGVPIGGAEQAAFCGNYSGTAFGVHEGAEDAFLCHLGPGTKHFYCWAPEVFEKHTGGKEPVFGDYQWLLKHGECFVMEPGDALFLPKRVFHVGRQDTFSISVAMPLYTFPDDRLLRLAVLPELLDDVLGEDPHDPLGTQSPMHAAADGGAEAIQRLTERARTALAIVGERLQAGVARQVERRWNSVWSNGGWELVDNDLGRTQAVAAFEADRVRPGATVSIPAPYQLRITGAEQAFLRGIDVACDTGPLTADLVGQLNSGAPVTLPHDDALCTTIAALGSTGGIRIITDSNLSEAAA